MPGFVRTRYNFDVPTHPWTQSPLILFLLLSLAACGGGRSRSVIKDCILPNDQLGTLTGKWRVTPIPIAFHQGDFTAAEMAAILQGADAWNEFYAASLKLTPVDFGSSANPRTSTVARPTGDSICNTHSIVQGSGYSGQVVIYKNSTWPFPDQPSVIAITSYCRTAAKPLPYFYMQIIDVNYQNFFVSGTKQPDLQSIVFHELGHMLGLNHTCGATAQSGVPSCSDPGLNPDYITALMYPTFGFDQLTGAGEQKRSLTTNDEGRANCLYISSGS